MSIVTLSSRFQVVIPRDVRERLGLRPGQQVEAIPFKGRIAGSKGSLNQLTLPTPWTEATTPA